MLAHGHAEVRSRNARIITLALGPGEQFLKYHNELHRYVRVVQTVVTFQLVLGDVQDQVRAAKEGVYPDWALAFLDGLKLAQNIGILPSANTGTVFAVVSHRGVFSATLHRSSNCACRYTRSSRNTARCRHWSLKW